MLHHARGTAVHTELRDLAHELLWDLAGVGAGTGRAVPGVLWGRRVAPAEPAARGDGAFGSLRRRLGDW